MAIAKIDRNSKLGAAVELRRKKQNDVREEENTAKIDRNSAMGQYLVSTAADTVNSIMQSVKGNASLFENQQNSFSKFAQNNNRYIGDSEAAQKFSADFGKYADTLNKQAKQLRRIGMGEGNELYDTLTEQARYFSTNNMWLKNRMEYSSRFKDAKDENKNYYGWLNDNAVTDSVTASERAKIYDENNARIAEIDEEMKTVGRQWNGTGGIPVFTGWGNKEKYKELKAEKENLEAENRRYDRTQGKTDSNYKLTQNADFKQNSYAGENKNPSHEDVLKWYNDYTMSGGSWGASQDILDMMPVVDDELSLYDTTKNIEWNDVTSNENDAYYTNYIKGKQNAWEFLTDEERGIYYYLRNTKGKEAGDEFLESMATVLGKRATDEIARNAHDMSGGELFLNNLVSVPATVLGNIGAFADTVSQLITGKEYNPYSVGNRIQAYAGTVRGETANRLDDATNNFSLLGQSAGDVYQALMSSVDSATGVFVLGSPLHLAQAGMGALTSTARELYDRGASGAQILGVSVAAGVFEVLFEKVSLDHFTEKLMGTPTRTMRDVIKKTLVQGGVEASEEFFTEAANMITEAVILGDMASIKDDISQYMQKGDTEAAATAKAVFMNLYNAAAGGFISGGAMGGVSATAQYANHQLSEVPSMGQDVIDRNGVQELADSAYKISNNAQNRDEKNRIDGVKTKRTDRVLADAATEALKNQNARTVGTLADMVTARTEQAVEQMKKAQNAELVKDAGLKGIEAFAVKRALNSEDSGRISQKIIKESDVFNKAEAARFEKAKQRFEERKAKIEQADRRIEADGAEINKAVRSGNTAKLVKNRSEGVRSDGLDVSLGAVTGVENGRISVEFDPDTHAVAAFDASGTETVSDNGSAAKTVKASSPETNALYEGINRAVTGTVDADSGTDVTGRTVNTGTKMSVNAANLALSMYNETANADASVYTRIMYETYKAGKRGLPFETLRESIAAEYDIGAYDGTVTGTQIKQMYKAGASEFEARPGVQRIGVKSVTTGEHKNALTQLSAIDLFAKKHGITIIAVDSLTDAEGNAINGEYRTGNNIVISLDADGGLYMPVVGHEIFHYAESINAEDAKALAELIIDTLKASKGEEWLEARRREYAGYGYKGEQIDSEIAADFFGAAVTQKEFERQIKAAELNKSFTQKIIDKVKEVVAELKEIMRKLRGQRLIYDAALDTDTETLDFFVDNLERILNQAGTETSVRTDGGEVRRMYAGTKAENADASLLEEAKKRIKNGDDAENVRKATGWFKGYDGKWRFEIDDSKSHLIENPKLVLHGNNTDGFYRMGKLTDVYSNAELFKAYPELKNVTVIIQETETGVSGSAFSRDSDKQIVLSQELFKRYTKEYNDYLNGGRLAEIKKIEQTPEYREYSKYYDDEDLQNSNPEQWLKDEQAARKKFFDSELGKRYYKLNWGKPDIQKYELGWSKNAKEVLLHELQHMVQSIEKTAQGSSPQAWRNRILEAEDNYKGADRLLENKAYSMLDVLDRYGFEDINNDDFLITSDKGIAAARAFLESIDAPRGALDMLDNLREYMRDRDTAQSEYLKIKNRSPGELYKATAGEIEARDTAKRANLTAEERKNTRPDIDRTDVVFANNSSESMEIVTLDNGKQYVHASEQQVIEGNNSQLWKQQIARYINKELRNWNDFDILTVEGDVLTLTKNTAYKAGSVNQVRNQDGTYRVMTQAEYLTKLNAEVHINELAQISKKIKKPNVPDSKNHSFAKNGFSYRTAYFQDYDGEYYKITLSVGENGNISTVYNVGKLKKDTLPNGTIKSVFSGSKADSVSNGTTVTQKSPSVNSILSDSGEKITKFQKKLPDVQEKLKKMSGSDDIDDVKRMAYGLADDFMKYAKAARLEMTETRGLMPQPTRVSEIVAKYNDYRKTGVSNKQLESDITDIFTDYMNGVGSSGTLFNYITDTIMKRELNSYEVIGDETFKAVRAYTDGGRFKVNDATVGSLVDTFGSLGEINGILRENYGFTIAKETDTRAEARAVWAPVGAQLAEEAGYVFDGTDYTENAKGGFEYETLASLLQTAQNDPRIYRGWLTGANTPDARILAQDELADRVEEEALKMYGELMSAPARSTKADRYRKMLFDYSVKHAAQLDRLENRLAENKLRVEELKAENRAKMQELRGTKNEEIETVKQAYRERMKTQRVKRNETASKAKVRSQITKRVKILNALLTRETDAKHIPQELKHTVAEFLLPFTEDSSVFGKAKDDVLSLERYVRMNDLLTDIYNATEGDSADGAALNERYRSLAGNLDGDLVRDFGEMRRTMAGKRLSQLSLDELQTVNKIVVNIANMVKQGRETFINGKKESLDEIGRETVSDLTSRRQRRKHLKPVDWAINLMNDKETTPIYFFGEKLGGFFGQIYRDIRDAQDKWYVRCAEAQRSIEDLQDKYNFKKWSGKADKGVTFTLDDGGTVTLTREQILSIYATAKRERNGGNNTTHVFDGGIVVDDELRRGLKDKVSTAWAQRSEKGVKAFSDAFSEQIRSEARHLTVNDLAQITAALTDEQKAYADSVVGLLSTTVGGWGNETSMEMYGYKKFTEDYYFPVMSDKSYLYTRFGISDDTRLKHAGFTNKVVRGANNPIIITGFTNVAAGHINQMALYSSFTVPIENMTRLYNYELSPSEDADGHTVRGMSVKKALTNAYGNAANEYIADFMRALNGGIKADSVENFLDWGTSKFKRAAVMANLSVIVQQPSAIARATALINPKYLVGVPNETLPKTVAEMYKYSAVAGIKKLGGFDTGTGMSVTQWISNSEQSFSEKASDLLGKGAEKADEVTWANIWAAVKRELNARIRSGKSELKPGSEEYYRAVADRFRDIIDYTQVYDSVLSKSQLMRSKSGLARMMTSFMAEPTLSYNLVVNSFKGDTVNGGRAIAAFAANVVLNTLLQSLVAALRDKEDISYWERYIKNVTESLTGGKLPVAGSEFNVFGNLPLVKDAISVMQGYDVPRTDMSLVTAAADVLKKLMKVTANRDKLSKDKSKKYKNMTLYQEKLFDVMWDAGVMITNFTPLPMQSVSREIKGVINNVSHWAGDAEHYKTTSYTLRDAVKEGAGFGEDNPLKAYNALKNKEDEVLRRLKQSDSWQTWVRNGLKKYDRGDDLDKKAINRIEKAATANYSGDYDTYERLVGAIEKEGFDRNDILAAVESLVGDMRPKEEPDEPADKHLYTTKMLEDAIRQNSSEAVKDIKQKLKDVEGKTDDNIRSAVKKIARESYYEKGDEDGAIRVLRDYGDMSADEIKDTVDWFSYSVLNPDSELVYNSWQSWRSKASNGQVNNGRGKLTAAQYEAYTQAVKGITGDDLNGDGKTDSGTKKKKVLAAINKLPLTKDQKNTLYLVNGYGKDSIGEAPWN